MTKLKNEGWVKCGENINYKLSKLSINTASNTFGVTNVSRNANVTEPVVGKKKYYMLTFEYTFNRPNDEVYFAYALPYTFSKLHNFVKTTMEEHSTTVRILEQQHISPSSDVEEQESKQVMPVSYSEHAFIKESKFCHSLSGLEVPELTITSQVNKLAGKPTGAPL